MPIKADQLKDIVSLGLKHSTEIEIQKIRHTNQKYSTTDSYTALLPTLDFSAGRNFSKDDSKNSTSISSSWNIWDNWQNITNIKTGELAEEISGIGTFIAKQDYILKVLEAYFSHQILLSDQIILESKKAQAEWSLKHARELVNSGEKTSLDALDAEIEMDKIKREEIDLNNKLTRSLRALNNLVGPKQELSIQKEEIVKMRPYYLDKFEKIKGSLSNFRDGKLLDDDKKIIKSSKELNKSRLELDQTKLDHWPKLKATAGYTWSGDEYVEGNVDKPGIKGAPTASIGLAWDLWHWNSIDRKILRAANNFKISEIELEKLRRDRIQELTDLIEKFQIAEKTISASDKILRKAELKYKKSKEMYNLGQRTLFDLQRSSSDLANTKKDYASRLKDQYINISKILVICGQDISP